MFSASRIPAASGLRIAGREFPGMGAGFRILPAPSSHYGVAQ